MQMKKSKTDQTLEGIYGILSNTSKGIAFLHQAVPFKLLYKMIYIPSLFDQPYFFTFPLKKITADQILHQYPVLLYSYVWSLLTYLDIL